MTETHTLASDLEASSTVAQLREYPRAERSVKGPRRSTSPSRTRPSVRRIPSTRPASKPVQPPRPRANSISRSRVPARVGAAEPIGIDGFGAVPTSSAELPDAASSVQFVVRSIMEVFSGRRALTQITHVLSGDVFEALSVHVGAQSCSQRRSVKILRITTQEPDDGVAEGAAVIAEGTAVYSVALRLEGLDGTWQCSVFEIV